MLCFFVLYIVSISMVMGCGDWFMIWLGLEINMMSFIVLIYNRDTVSAEVCMKYFFIQSMGSGILLMMFYSDFIWFDYTSMMIFSYKMGGGPFFFWFPSVCESLGWGGCFLLMSVQKVLPLLLITLVVSSFLWFIVLSSLLIGTMGSFNQSSIKRLMAYSSIHHVGWMLVGNFVSGFMSLNYLAVYSMLILGIIWSLSKDKIFHVSFLHGMSAKWAFVIGMLSMGGMPPMLGFYLKWWMFLNILNGSVSVLTFMVFTSVTMFYVYLRVVYGVLMGGSSLVSWNTLNNVNKLVSFDLMYMMGINLGVFVWLSVM